MTGVVAALYCIQPSFSETRPEQNSKGIDFLRPTGVYAFSWRLPDKSLLNKPFVDGWTMLLHWKALETSQGVYDFSLIEQALAGLKDSKKKLSIVIGSTSVPDWLLDSSNIQTYQIRLGPGERKTVVPWDATAQAAWAEFIQALGEYRVPDDAQGGVSVPLRDHSLFTSIMAQIPGMYGIRDREGRLVKVFGYNRSLLRQAIIQSLDLTVDNFPRQFKWVIFFRLGDKIQSPPLYEYLIEALAQEYFDGQSPPRLGLYMENLSCQGPHAGSAPELFAAKEETFIVFQAVQPWIAPFSNPKPTDACLVTELPGDRSTATSGPEVAIKLAYETFNCRRFEMWEKDLQHPGFADEFQKWHDILVSTAAGRPTGLRK